MSIVTSYHRDEEEFAKYDTERPARTLHPVN
jgi:hypothetical protein